MIKSRKNNNKKYKYKNNRKNKRTKKYTRRKRYLKKGGTDPSQHNNACFYKPEEKKWPLNFGCLIGSNEQVKILNIGDIIDRFGWNKGYYFGDIKNSYDSRSLLAIKGNEVCDAEYIKDVNKGTFPTRIDYNQYSILKPFEVMTCTAAPLPYHKGFATQYRLYDGSITDISDKEKISEKNDISDKLGNKLKNVKVPNVEELIKLGYIKIIENPTPPPFI